MFRPAERFSTTSKPSNRLEGEPYDGWQAEASGAVMAAARDRIDWMPGAAAKEALAEAERRFPGLRRQALIDKLVITAVSALTHTHWTPPALHGRDRDRWPAQAVSASRSKWPT